MSRSGSSMAARPLTATEELEKLEQSITLTLQEIDRNFSKAHHVVTTSILPVVEQYGEHCRSVWDASKFWKQFFEAAANVSLSGYEDLANDDEDMTGAEETTVTHDETSTDYTLQPRDGQNDGGDGGDDHTESYRGHARDESLLTDDGGGDLSGSTPRPPATTTNFSFESPLSSSQQQHQPQFADMDSPYENLRREMNRSGGSRPRSRSGSRPPPPTTTAAGKARAARGAGTTAALMDLNDNSSTNDAYPALGGDGDTFDSSAADSELLAQRTARLPDMSMTPRPSPDERSRRAREEAQATARQQKDPLMHRILDKTYRIQATPHRTPGGAKRGLSPMRLRLTERAAAGAAAAATKDDDDNDDRMGGGRKAQRAVTAAWDSSPMSSPEMAVPKLRSAAFMSPVRAAYRSKLAAATATAAGAAGPRTPGASVQTPAAVRSRTRDGEAEVTFADIDATATAGGPAVSAAASKPAAAAAAGKAPKRDPDEITWESSDEDGDEDLYGGMSPPKTISFAFPPSKLLQTPAREASKRIVDDILYTAGDDPDDDLDRSSEYSPTMVKANADILDETF